jgi:hypothetical protein
LQAFTRDGSVVDATGEDGSIAGKTLNCFDHGAAGDPGSGMDSITGVAGDENQLVKASSKVVTQIQPSDIYRLTRKLGVWFSGREITQSRKCVDRNI